MYLCIVSVFMYCVSVSPEYSEHFQTVLHDDSVQASQTGSARWTSADPYDTFGDYLTKKQKKQTLKACYAQQWKRTNMAPTRTDKLVKPVYLLQSLI